MYVYEVTIANASNAFLQRYRLLIVLVEHNGPINSFTFNYNGSFLVSGGEVPAFQRIYQLTHLPGDDQTVRVWDVINHFPLFQTIADRNCRWGQITCLKFITLDAVSDWLFFGTGRGRFLVYRRIRKSVMCFIR